MIVSSNAAVTPMNVEPNLLAHGLLQDPGAVPLVIGVVGHRDLQKVVADAICSYYLALLDKGAEL